MASFHNEECKKAGENLKCLIYIFKNLWKGKTKWKENASKW